MKHGIWLLFGGWWLFGSPGGLHFTNTRSTAQAASTSRPTSRPSSKQAIPHATLTQAQAERFAALSVHCSTTEYPYKLGQVLGQAQDLKSPKALHPAFYGCFDWHSAVHGHWSMIRLLKYFPKMRLADQIRTILDRHLTQANIEREAAFFRSKYHETFERPYGWGWYLRLVSELHTWPTPQAKRWRTQLRPLEALLVERLPMYLQRLSVPVREGTHASTAFALVHALDYAKATKNEALQRTIISASRRFYLQDRQCPTAYEPSGEDFISPCLAQADLMRRVLRKKAFERWLRDFLPPLSSSAFRTLRIPPQILATKDYKIGHLIGLSLHRAWSMRGIAASLPPNDHRVMILLQAARIHRHFAHKLLFDSGYGGTHWLASFAVYDHTAVGIPPATNPSFQRKR